MNESHLRGGMAATRMTRQKRYGILEKHESRPLLRFFSSQFFVSCGPKSGRWSLAVDWVSLRSDGGFRLDRASLGVQDPNADGERSFPDRHAFFISFRSV